MGHKLKIAGWISLGVMAGALTTVSLQTVARGTLAPLPLEELQQLAAVFGMVKSDYVEPVRLALRCVGRINGPFIVAHWPGVLRWKPAGRSRTVRGFFKTRVDQFDFNRHCGRSTD